MIANVSPWAAWPLMAHIGSPCCPATYRRFALPPGIAIEPDLRVVDARGADVPYAIDVAPSNASDEREVPLSDVGFVPGHGTQAVLDLGSSGEFRDAVTLDVPQAIFFGRTSIEGSDDRKTWRLIRDDAYLYRVPGDANENLTLTFERTGARWLRIRFLDGRTALPIARAFIVPSPARAKDSFADTHGAPTLVRASDPQSQRWTITFARPLEASAIRVEETARSFERRVDVEDSADGKIWNDVGSGTVARFENGDPQTTFAFAEDRARFWRVTVRNGSDEPVPGMLPHLMARPHELVFAATSAGPYVLYLGNDAELAASYDLADRLAHQKWEARDVELSDVVANPAYADTRSLLDRDPAILPALFLVVACVLIGFALRVVFRREPDVPRVDV